MITFGEFTGLLLSDFLQARKFADAASASISEEYHVNPLLKGMPIPRYTIQEAEIQVPVRIMGVQKVEIGEEDMKRLLQKMGQVLPTLLYRNLKNCYYDKQEAHVYLDNGVVEPDSVGIVFQLDREEGADGKRQVIRLSKVPELKACYKSSTASICTLMNQYMNTYVNENNISAMKLLDLTDAFMITLKEVCKQEFSTYPDEQTPFIDKNALKKMCQVMGSTMFFEFKEIFEQTEGVLVSPETGKMEEHCAPEQLMHVKLKLREQDVDFVVDKNERTGELNRFMTLT